MEEQQEHLERVLRGNAEISKNLYKVFAREAGSIIFSPSSIHTILALTAQGAEGSSKEAFAEVLKIPDVSAAAAGYGILINHPSLIEHVTLSTANKLFPACELQEVFNQVVLSSFHSEVQHLDFSERKSVANTINSWVKEKIKDIINAMMTWKTSVWCW